MCLSYNSPLCLLSSCLHSIYSIDKLPIVSLTTHLTYSSFLNITIPKIPYPQTKIVLFPTPPFLHFLLASITPHSLFPYILHMTISPLIDPNQCLPLAQCLQCTKAHLDISTLILFPFPQISFSPSCSRPPHSYIFSLHPSRRIPSYHNV